MKSIVIGGGDKASTGMAGTGSRDNTNVQYTQLPQREDAKLSTTSISDKTPQASPSPRAAMLQTTTESPHATQSSDRHSSSPAVSRRRRGDLGFSGYSREQPLSFASTFLNYLKDPRTILRICQFILAICALAAIVDSPHLISVFCQENVGTYLSYSYPYKMNKKSLHACEDQCFLTRGDRCSSSAQFFAFVAVASFIVSPAFALTTFMFLKSKSRSDLINLIAFIADAVISVAWFAGSIAWAAAVTEIRQITQKSYIAGLIQAQSKFTECTIFAPTNGSLIVSVILGFCNCVLWIVSCLFAFKASNLFNKRKDGDELGNLSTGNAQSSSSAK